MLLPDLTGRRAVVTGANAGLGLASACALTAAGAEVLLAVRDLAKGDAAAAQIRSRHPNARVAVARVFAQSTPLLLLDEPTASLDVRFQELVLRAVRRRVRDGATAIVVVHDLALAAAYASRVVLLSRGEIVGDGPPHAVLTSSLLSDVYEHPIDVTVHPRSGEPLILPERDRDT